MAVKVGSFAALRPARRVMPNAVKRVQLGYVEQQQDALDRRVKRLQLSPQGSKLEFELTEAQRRLVARVFERSGPGAEKHWRRVMALLGEEVDF